MMMYKVLNIDVDTHIISYKVQSTLSKAITIVNVSRYELNYTKEKIKANDLVTFSNLYFHRLNIYEGKNIKKVNLI